MNAGLGLSSLLLASAGIGCGRSDDGLAHLQEELVAECVAQDAPLPDEAWVCPETQQVECSSGTGTGAFPTLYVRAPQGDNSCLNQTLSVNEGVLGVGSHQFEVRNESGALVCQTTATVTDSVAPVLTPKTLNLWPPNHKFHTITVDDCVTVQDACDSQLKAEFIWASSDEPVDDIGDGHHAPDIRITDCNAVELRAERQGPKDGRVYKLGVRVVDAGGNASEAVCQVVVDHDQRGVLGADSGEAYRILLDGSNRTPTCDGENPPPATPPREPPVSQPPVSPVPQTPPQAPNPDVY